MCPTHSPHDLAADAVPQQAPATDSAAAGPGDDRRIAPHLLLLDDDRFMLGMQARMLQAMGYSTVKTSTDAQEALALLRREPQEIDVIVCDLNMPGTDGIEFLRLLDATAFRGNVILLSGEGVRIMHTVQKLLSGGRLVILGALEKPAGRAALRALLDCWKPLVDTLPKPEALAVTVAEMHIANRDGQWLLHYQPQVELRTGMLIGMEALVRWNHPRHGLLYPDSFIDAAEECGAIDGLTQSVLRTALEQLARWQAQGKRLQMAVNVSMENLRSADFSPGLGQMAHDCGVSPSDVTLEITESRLMCPTESPLESLVRLRLQRFGLSIDDFGTGHSSLAQLRDIPFTELKVDRGFVLAARHNQIIRPILEASIGIAKRLDMRSVAEGVESEDDWRLMQEIGCDFAQGYFIGKPMPCEAVPAWSAAWDARRLALRPR